MHGVQRHEDPEGNREEEVPPEVETWVQVAKSADRDGWNTEMTCDRSA
jgi:hypothetical protein